jgi:phage repressor protein C with HTH and peptisase S24 domain
METNAERRRRKLAELCQSRGLKAVADRADLNPATLDQIIKGVLLPPKKDGSRSPRSLGDEAARKIEDAESLGLGWFDTPGITTSKVKFSLGNQAAQGDLSIPPSNTLGNENTAKNDDKLIHAGGVGRGRLVPVVGMARLGDNGFYEEISSMTGAGDGMVEAYSNDPHAYALRVRGDSMFPSIRDGWYVIVEPSSAAAPGDYVLIKLKTGQKMVKELIMLRPDGITVVSVNGDARKTIEADEIDPHFGIQAVSAIVSPRKWIPA